MFRRYALLCMNMCDALQVADCQHPGERREKGEPYDSLIAACLGKAVDEDKSVQAYRKGKNQ
jgi:hypothetical protein